MYPTNNMKEMVAHMVCRMADVLSEMSMSIADYTSSIKCEMQA